MRCECYSNDCLHHNTRESGWSECQRDATFEAVSTGQEFDDAGDKVELCQTCYRNGLKNGTIVKVVR